MPIQSNNSGGGGVSTETDPIYTADKPNIALKSEIPDVSGFITLDEVPKTIITNLVKEDGYSVSLEINGVQKMVIRNSIGIITEVA